MDEIDKLLRKIPPKHRAQIIKAIECLGNPNCRAGMRPEKLSGTDSLWRIHVGKYRIIVRSSDAFEIVHVRLRNEKTYRNI